MKDNRHFIGSICVRIGTERTKLELSPASIHGGGDGFRVRVNRRWLNAPEGGPLFVGPDRLGQLGAWEYRDEHAGLGQLVADVALGGMPSSEPEPDLPVKTRVSIRRETDGIVWHDGAWTVSPPIRGYDGRWYVAVTTAHKGIGFVPVSSVIRSNRNGHTE